MKNALKFHSMKSAICFLILLLPALPRAQSASGTFRILQGPILGEVRASSIQIWVRVYSLAPVSIRYSEAGASEQSGRSVEQLPQRTDDYILKFTLTDLAPATRYHYEVLIDGKRPAYLGDLMPFSFETAPPADWKGSFSVAMGSCARIQTDRTQAIWTRVAQAQPDLFFWTGDNIYGDALDPAILAEEYQHQRSIEALQLVNYHIPQLAVWDDHDFGLNDHDATNPVKKEALEVFTRYWVNPTFGTSDAPGVFFTYSYGGIDFFFLDCRYYRDPNKVPDHPQKTLLGATQMAWLKSNLKQSVAPFKVLISGSGWSKAKGPGGDSWASFLHERDQLFDFITTEGIAGVILLSGDTHVAELNAIPWSDRGGYDFYELVSSPLAQRTNANWLNRRPEVRMRPVYFSTTNFGLLTFDTAKDDPELVMQVVGLDGKPAWSPLVIKASELRNGRQTWPEKIDPVSARRLKQQQTGQGYYWIKADERQ